MRRAAAAICTAIAIGAGCASEPPAPVYSSAAPVAAQPVVAAAPVPATKPTPATAPPSVPADSSVKVVAMVNGHPITQEQLIKPLIESQGLNILLQLIQLELARQLAAQQHLVVSAAEIRTERDIMLKGAFSDAEAKDYDTLLDQLLRQQNMSHAQFDILTETNAYLRKLAEPLCEGKIQEENLKLAFNMMYGEKVSIRDITVSNMREAQEVRQRVTAGGEDFGTVAEQVSKDIRTRGLKGELPPFSRQSANIPDTIKNLAFDMKDGEVSDAITVEGAWHVIKVIKHIAPTIVKYEDQKASVQKLLYEKLVQETMKGIRGELARAAMAPGVMKIENQELRRQFDQRVAEHKAAAKEEAAARQEAAGMRKGPATAPAPADVSLTPATQPATVPATLPAASQPSNTGAGRPPATKPGAAAGTPSVPATQPGHPATTSNSTKP